MMMTRRLYAYVLFLVSRLADILTQIARFSFCLMPV